MLVKSCRPHRRFAVLVPVLILGLLALALGSAALAAPRKSVPSPLAVMHEAIRGLETHAGNAGFKIRNGVSGMGAGAAAPGAFATAGCCSLNREKMREHADTLQRERTDLQRLYEKSRNSEGLEKLAKLSADLRQVEEGLKVFGEAQTPEVALMAVQGLGVLTRSLEVTRAELEACCVP